MKGEKGLVKVRGKEGEKEKGSHGFEQDLAKKGEKEGTEEKMRYQKSGEKYIGKD